MGGEGLLAQLETGVTRVCRCWAVTRADGVVLGFTDHDRVLSFEGVTFRPDSGLTPSALVQTTGLSMDNTEVVGALTGAAITDADVLAGRYDGASVVAWLVDWQNVAARRVLFRGAIGEVTRSGGAFRAELRGLSEALNRPEGRVLQRPCPAVLGDARCGVDLDAPGLSVELPAEQVEGGRVFRFAGLSGYAARWFERGRMRVNGGAGAGAVGVIKADREADHGREIELWEPLRAPVVPGDALRLEAGCDKRARTCREKFGNFANFRGFPHIPGEDWLTSYPKRAGINDGASLVSGGTGGLT